MAKITRLSIVLGLFIVSFSIAKAGEADSSKSLPTAPLHSFEGGSGVFLTNFAYLAKPPKEGEILGPLSISASMILLDGISRYAYAVTENIFGNIELGLVNKLGFVFD